MEKEKNYEGDQEVEQTPEQILEVLMNAAERGLPAKMIVRNLDGKSTTTNIDTPHSFDGGCVIIETQEGPVISIELNRIVKAEIL